MAWTKTTNPIVDGWAKVTNPATGSTTLATAGTPIGLLLALTYGVTSSVVSAQWNKTVNPSVDSWIKVTNPS